MDPARFWEITPRLLDVEIRGAKLRLRREKEMVWWTAMLPLLEKKPTLEKFLGDPVREADRVKQFHEAWDKIDRALRH